MTTFPTCWQKCDLGWLGWLWPGPSSQMEDVIICEACLEVARARPWLHQQLSTAHNNNSNNTIQTVAGWEVERRGLLTFNQVQTNKYLDIKYLNILYIFSTVRFPEKKRIIDFEFYWMKHCWSGADNLAPNIQIYPGPVIHNSLGSRIELLSFMTTRTGSY